MTIYFRIFLFIISLLAMMFIPHCVANAQTRNEHVKEQARHLMEEFNRQLQQQPRESPAVVRVQQVSSSKIEQQRELIKFNLTVILLEQKAVKETCARLGVWGGQVPNVPFAVGCTSVNLSTNEATIYASRPTTLNDQRTLVLGHELWHVIAGRYHEE